MSIFSVKIFIRNTILLSIFLLLLNIVQSQNSPIILEGKSSHAIGYTVHHNVIGIVTSFGDLVDEDKRTRVIEYIDSNVFSENHEAPLVFFIGHEYEGDGVLLSVFIAGDRQIDVINDQRWFNLSELSNKAETFVGVYNLLSGNQSKNN